jgi:hypothetical protein
VLEGDRVAGRIDMSAVDGRTCLAVRAFWPERGVAMGRGRQARLLAEIERAARFAGCGEIRFEEDWIRCPKAC